MRRISVRVVLAFVTRLWDTHDRTSADTQFAFGLTFPTPGTFWSTGGSPPFTPDDLTPTNSNEPYLDWLAFILKQKTIPQTISTSYADDEQTGTCGTVPI